MEHLDAVSADRSTRSVHWKGVVAGWLIAYVAIAAMIVGLGLLLMDVLLPAGLGRLDAATARWFVLQRTPELNAITRIGSDLGSTPVIVGVAILTCGALALRRRWDAVVFLAFALSLEVAVFLTATLLVDRERPMVHRLDATPATASYPSGHTAASLALYGGIAVIVWLSTSSRFLRWFSVASAALLVAFVGVSRIYRGMHHLSDVIASVLLGSCALLAAWLVVYARAERSPEQEATIHEAVVEVRA